jgi:glycosyltransferase involved in cell wall biosynthesis
VERIPFGAAIQDAAASGAADPGETAVLRSPSSRDPDLLHTILFVGRLVERKGVAVLLEALARLRSARPVRLWVVGDGPLREPLRRRAEELGIADRVEFPGFVSEEELSRRFRDCDVFVLPAIRDAKGDVEGLGVVLIEALLHARPVVASDSGGIRDIVRDGETGLLVPPGDAAALAAALRRVLEEPELAVRLVQTGRRHVATHFSWDTIIDRLAALYDRLAGGTGASDPDSRRGAA